MIKEHQIHIGSRLKLLRTRMEMSQAEFCKNFSIFAGMSHILPTTTLSSYECDLKRPPYEMLCAFSDYYNVSIEYLMGISDSEDTSAKQVKKKNLFLDDFIIEITKDNLKNYDKKPVYIIFVSNDGAKYGSWGIYNKDKNCFCCSNETIENSDNLHYYAATPDLFPLPRRVLNTRKKRTPKPKEK